VNSRNPIYSGTGYYATGGGDDDTQIGTSPAYSVTKDNTGN
jgi:hypothetical protein